MSLVGYKRGLLQASVAAKVEETIQQDNRKTRQRLDEMREVCSRKIRKYKGKTKEMHPRDKTRKGYNYQN
jgi:hypothetical protein